MANYLWRVTAKRNVGSKIAQGMWVEIVISNIPRQPNQKEVINAINAKYGAGTAPPGLAMTNFEMVKL